MVGVTVKMDECGSDRLRKLSSGANMESQRGKQSARKRAKEQARRSQEDPKGRCHESLSGHTLSELTRRGENQTICGNKFDLGLKIVSHKIATQL